MYDTSIDMWSIACTLYELYTGKFLFDGGNNNEMLKVILQKKGKLNNKLLGRGTFIPKYFDQSQQFQSIEVDPITRKPYIKPTIFGDQPVRDMYQELCEANPPKSQEETKKLKSFKDLLDKCLALDPKCRLTPEDALLHPFIRTYSVKKT